MWASGQLKPQAASGNNPARAAGALHCAVEGEDWERGPEFCLQVNDPGGCPGLCNLV